MNVGILILFRNRAPVPKQQFRNKQHGSNLRQLIKTWLFQYQKTTLNQTEMDFHLKMAPEFRHVAKGHTKSGKCPAHFGGQKEKNSPRIHQQGN